MEINILTASKSFNFVKTYDKDFNSDSCSKEDIEKSDTKPDYVIENIRDLCDILKS